MKCEEPFEMHTLFFFFSIRPGEMEGFSFQNMQCTDVVDTSGKLRHRKKMLTYFTVKRQISLTDVSVIVQLHAVASANCVFRAYI